MTDNETAVQTATPERGVAPRAVHSSVIEAYESMLSEVPDAGNEGIEGILEAIMAADSAAELDSAWNAQGLGKYVGVPIVITGIRKMPSEFDGGLAFFLVVDGAVLATGEKIAATTGSTGCVAQLVRAWSLDAFPWTCVPTLSRRPTADGYYPMHLENVR